MVEINFLEQKKRNMLLYTALGTFLILLLLSSVLLFWQTSSQETKAEALELQLETNKEQQEKVEDDRILQQSRLTLEQHVTTIEAMAFPTLPLVDRMIALLPENANFENFSYEKEVGLNISIQIKNLDQAAAYTHALEKEMYIENVHLSSIAEGGAESKTDLYVASFFVEIDEELWIGENTDEN